MRTPWPAQIMGRLAASKVRAALAMSVGAGELAHALGRGVALGRLGHLRDADVGGELQDHGSAAPVAQALEGAPHLVGDATWAVDGLDGLDEAPVVLDGGEVGSDLAVGEGVATGQHEHGDVVGEGLRQAAHGVLGAGRVLRDGDAEAVAVADAAVGVGGHEGAAFVSEHDGADADLGGGFDEGVVGEAAEVGDAFLLEDLGDVFVAVHGDRSPLGCGAASAAAVSSNA